MVENKFDIKRLAQAIDTGGDDVAFAMRDALLENGYPKLAQWVDSGTIGARQAAYALLGNRYNNSPFGSKDELIDFLTYTS